MNRKPEAACIIRPLWALDSPGSPTSQHRHFLVKVSPALTSSPKNGLFLLYRRIPVHRHHNHPSHQRGDRWRQRHWLLLRRIRTRRHPRKRGDWWRLRHRLLLRCCLRYSHNQFIRLSYYFRTFPPSIFEYLKLTTTAIGQSIIIALPINWDFRYSSMGLHWSRGGLVAVHHIYTLRILRSITLGFGEDGRISNTFIVIHTCILTQLSV
jgi:hypothetical protein